MDLRGSLGSYGAAIVEVLFVEKNTCLSDLNSTDKIIVQGEFLNPNTVIVRVSSLVS